MPHEGREPREAYLQSGVVDAVVKEASFPVAVIKQTYDRTGWDARVQSPRTDLNPPQNNTKSANIEKKKHFYTYLSRGTQCDS